MAFDRTNGPIVRTAFEQPDPTGKTGLFNYAVVNAGAVPSARLDFATDASNADTIAIGGKTFKFLTTLIAADATVQVKRGTDAATTLANLIAAINNDTTNSNWVEATTPFAVAIVADAVTATKLRIRYATARGGLPIAGASGSVALTESLTPAASIWSCGNLNVAGKAPGSSQFSMCRFIPDATAVTNGSYQIELQFTPTVVMAFVTSSAGVQRASTDAVTISSNAVNIALAGGASPAIQAGDLVTVLAIE